MLEMITFLGHQISGAHVTGLDLMPDFFAFTQELEIPGKAYSLVDYTFLFSSPAILSAKNKNNEFANSFIMSWRLRHPRK